MTQRIRNLPQVQNVGAGLTAQMNITQGDVFNQIILTLGGTSFTKDHINEVRLMLGGKMIIPGLTGTQIATLNSYNNVADDATHLSLNFADILAKTIDGMGMSALNTKDFKYSDFYLEIDIDAAATAPTLDAWYTQGDGLVLSKADQITNDRFRVLKKVTRDIQGAGDFMVPVNTGSKMGNLLRQLAIFDPDGIVTHVEVLKDGITMMAKRSKADIEFMAKQAENRAVQSGVVIYDPIIHGVQGDALDVLRPDGEPASMEFNVTCNGAGTLYLVSDLLAMHAAI